MWVWAPERRYSVPRWVSIRFRNHQPMPSRAAQRPYLSIRLRRLLSSCRRPHTRVGGSARCATARSVLRCVSDDACSEPHERLMRRRCHMRRTNPAAGRAVPSRCVSNLGDRRPPVRRRPGSDPAGPEQIRPSRCVASRSDTEPDFRAGPTAAHVSCARKASPRSVLAATAPDDPVGSTRATTRSAWPPDRRTEPVSLASGHLCDTPALSFGIWIWA
jgi:hypothetical protein